MASSIYILSRPIRSGKTTELMEWMNERENVTGILTPDVDGQRKLMDIHVKQYYDLELSEPSNNSIAIGRFHFDRSVFERAQQILLEAIAYESEWLVIDEIGKLEIEQNTGLEPVVSNIIGHYKNNNKNLLLVIRDTLLNKAVDHYDLRNANIIHNLKHLS